MKKINFLFVLLVCASMFVQAQEPSNSPYVLPKFERSQVFLKNGDTIVKAINYNAVTEEMVFQQGGLMLALDNLDQVSQVLAGEHIFVLVNGKFYEKIGNWADGLLTYYKYRVLPPSAPAAYGSDGGSTSATNWTSLTDKATLYQFSLPDKFKIIRIQEFYLNKGGVLNKVSTFSQVASLFPNKKAALKALIKEKHLKFDNASDLKTIIGFCYGN